MEIKPKGTYSELAIEYNHGPLVELFICEALGLLRPLSQSLKSDKSVRLR